jgi:hypothetical protein
LSGRTPKLSGRGVREEENVREVWREEEKVREVCKTDEGRKKEQKKTYLLVSEPEASPGSSVLSSSKPADTPAASSSSSLGAEASSQTIGRRKGSGGRGNQGTKHDKIKILLIPYMPRTARQLPHTIVRRFRHEI